MWHQTELDADRFGFKSKAQRHAWKMINRGGQSEAQMTCPEIRKQL